MRPELRYIVVEGPIGVGKSSLTNLLSRRFEARRVMEVVEENPFLASFYGDRAKYAFQTQMFFLLSRYYQQRRSISELLAVSKSLISDYTFEKDALFARINLSGDELEMYDRLHEALAEKIIVPDLIVYLRAETETLMQRIARRDRPYERQMERAYIAELNQGYDSFFLGDQRHRSPVLVMDCNNLDYVRNPDDLHTVENRIRQELKLLPYQPELLPAE